MGKGGALYLLASRPHGTLYLGVTSDLPRRVAQHRARTIDGFTSRCGVTQLVWFELFPTILEAIAAEKKLKKWRRAWKVALIEKTNPDWRDLFDEISS